LDRAPGQGPGAEYDLPGPHCRPIGFKGSNKMMKRNLLVMCLTVLLSA